MSDRAACLPSSLACYDKLWARLWWHLPLNILCLALGVAIALIAPQLAADTPQPAIWIFVLLFGGLGAAGLWVSLKTWRNRHQPRLAADEHSIFLAKLGHRLPWTVVEEIDAKEFDVNGIMQLQLVITLTAETAAPRLPRFLGSCTYKRSKHQVRFGSTGFRNLSNRGAVSMLAHLWLNVQECMP
ncbi:hypothetical protein [Chitinilyticum piscinae]|uniref:Uncharacterized protein n=1 Tax=Chitinilyticum piscinae TaxID=2866724 RepID=A0A8J7FJ19_9NEIS|nr:hypothetical protein [Chitinilyticum piscinae]MBE9610240.1 hypothetical protein [Chitinilyticum piscinae]